MIRQFINELSLFKHKGSGRVSKIRQLRGMIAKELMEFLALQETMILGDALGVINAIGNQGQYGFCQVPAEGRSGEYLVFGRRSILRQTELSWEEVFCVLKGVGKIGLSQCLLSIFTVRTRATLKAKAGYHTGARPNGGSKHRWRYEIPITRVQTHSESGN